MPLDAFDLHEAMGNFYGDTDLMEEAIGLYFDEGPSMLGDVRRACEAGDLPAAQRAAHRFRGSLALFAARPAAQAARFVEEHARDGDLEGARSACADLDRAIGDLDRALGGIRK